MAVTNAQAETIYNRAMELVRHHGVGADGTSLAPEGQIASRLYREYPGWADLTHADALNAVKRAVRGRETAWQMTNDPTNRGVALARDYTKAPWIDARRGRYEWRVVVRMSGGGNEWETIVYVRSNTRLSGDEVMDRAESDMLANRNLHRDYKKKVAELGEEPTRVGAWIISALHKPATR